MSNTQSMKRAGYTCRRETISGQGYWGGDGLTCYRVRDRDGALVTPRIMTYQTARAAWADACERTGKAGVNV
jgi:hypothetical protein